MIFVVLAVKPNIMAAARDDVQDVRVRPRYKVSSKEGSEHSVFFEQSKDARKPEASPPQLFEVEEKRESEDSACRLKRSELL